MFQSLISIVANTLQDTFDIQQSSQLPRPEGRSL